MINTFPTYYKKFRCIADKCSDTCCAGWDVVVDSESLKKYKALKGAYADKINSLITVDSDGDCIFISKEKHCPFLLESGLCEMHIKLGEEALCRTCRQFPRHKTYFGARVETGISLSCPEAARLITESPDPIIFESEEIHAEIFPTAIDPERYFILYEARKTAINILQNRNFSIEKRIIAFLEFSQVIQVCLRKKEFVKVKKLTASDFLGKSCGEYLQKRASRALSRYFSDFKSMEMLNSNWLSELEKAENAQISSCPEYEWEFEHMMVYFVFRYFMTAVFDGDLLTKSKFAAVSFIVIRRLQQEIASDKQARIRTMQKYSKEVEHSAQNMEYLCSAMKKSRFYSVENITNILSLKEEIK